MNFFLKYWKQLIIAFLILVAIVVTIVLSKKAINKKREKEKESLINNNTVKNDPPTSGSFVDVSAKATEIHEALHGSWFSEDEERAINSVLSVENKNIPLLEKTYNSLFGKNLKSDLIKYLSASEWSKISYKFV